MAFLKSLALDVVFAAQADDGLQSVYATDELGGVLGDLFDVVGNRIVDEKPADGAFAFADIPGDAVDVAKRGIERINRLRQLVEVLAQLGFPSSRLPTSLLPTRSRRPS